MNRKIIKTFILVVLLVLLVAVASATDVSTDTTNTDRSGDVPVDTTITDRLVDVPADTTGTDTTFSIAEDTSPTATGTLQERMTGKQIENKEITKEEKNTKTENAPINAGNYSNLQKAFNRLDDEVTVNITDNITLQANPILNSNIKKLTIEGNGFTINGANTYRFLRVLSNSTVIIKNITIINCNYDGRGGAIENYATLTIAASNFIHNNAGWGGAISNAFYGNLIITDSNFTYNTATEFGGAISNEGSLVLIGSNFTHNNATGGGAIFNNLLTLNITDTNFTHNSATGYGYGGAILNEGTLYLTASNISYNAADSNGEAIHSYIWYTTVHVLIDNSTFTANNVTCENNEEANLALNITNNALIDTTFKIDNLAKTNNISAYVAKNKLNQSTGKLYDSIKDISVDITGFNDYYKYRDKHRNYLIEYNLNTKNTSLTIAANEDNPYINDTVTITVTLKDIEAKGIHDKKVSLIINNQDPFNITTIDGVATTKITVNESRENTIIALFDGDEDYNPSNNTITINSRKLPTKITTTITNKTAGNNTITIKITDKTNKQPVTSGQIEIINKKTNKTVAKATISSTNTTVTTTLNESGAYNLTVKYLGNDYYQVSQCAVNNLYIQKRTATLTVKTTNNTLNNTLVNITVTDKTTGKTIPNAQVTINMPNRTTINTTTGTTGTVTQKITLSTGKNTINVTYTGSKTYNNATKNHTIDVKKVTTKTTTTPVTAYLGDKITLTAKITAQNNVAINTGNVIFKLNGVTIKDNGKLSGSDNPLKIKVKNGVATTTITADNNMRNANQITAHYIENTDYTASNSTPAKITLQARNASITVTTNKKTIKQGQNLTITARVYDTTGGKKTDITSTSDEFVYFKINGITLKDAKGEMLKAKIVNGVATVNYTVPVGLSCVTDTQTMTPKNQTILAVFYSKTYQEDIKNTTTFQVERSNITINISNTTINNKTHTLSMKITIKDYLGNTVSGPNKCIIKVNGVTLKNGTQVMYYYTTDGVLNLKNIPVPQAKNYTTVEVITQDRLAYKSQRNTTTVIKVIN